nr:hypothetical protein [Tanacetum cinerariifolium]
MGSTDDIKSTLTQSALDALCEKFHIPDTVHPELPGHNNRIRNSPTDKIGILVLAFAKVSHFEILCPRSNCREILFFWVNSSVFPLSVMWHNNKTLKKDPHPTLTEFDAKVCDFLATHPAPFWKFLESFLCLVGISRYYELDDSVYPVFLADDHEEMDLFVFIHHADPTKVRIEEREVREGESGYVVQDEGANIVADDEIQATVANKPNRERKKSKAANRASGSSLPLKKLSADHGTSGVGVSTGQKFVVALQGLLERSALPVEVGVVAVATLPFVNSFVTLMLEREEGGRTKSVTRPQHPSKRFVVLSDSPCHSSSNALDAKVSFVIRSFVSDPPIMTVDVATSVVADTSFILVPRAGYELFHQAIFADSASMGEADPDVSGPFHLASTELSMESFYMSQDVDPETLHQVYVPKWNVTNDFSLDDLDVCRGVIDHLAHHVLFSQLRNMEYDQLLVEFNVGVARQTCLSSEVRLWLEHKLKGRKKFKGKCAMQADLLKEKDDEIASLKERLSLKEAEVMEAVCLCGQVSTVEATEAARVVELNIVRLSFCFGRSLGRAIDKGMHDGLATSIEHGKAGRDVVHARVQRIREDAVTRRLSLSDAMIPLIEPLSAENLVGEASTFGLPTTATTTALSTTFIQAHTVPLIPVVDYEVLGAGPSTEVPSPSKIVFEKEETTPEHTTNNYHAAYCSIFCCDSVFAPWSHVTLLWRLFVFKQFRLYSCMAVV